MSALKSLFAGLLVWVTRNTIGSDVIIDQSPAGGGGVLRSSQLWQDPGPNGNDLDGDAVCFADFAMKWPGSVSHIEWWGSGACELGFQIEFWKQDPGTIAYQPIGVFYYGGDHTVRPEGRFRVTPADYSTSIEGNLTHFVLDLPTPVQLSATNAANPRWFICVIGLTAKAYYTFDWAQGTATAPQTFQFIRGGTSGGGPLFRRLGDARALLVTGQLDSPPELSIWALNSQTVELSWDATKTGYSLVTCPTLPATNWSSVTNSVNTADGRCAVQVEAGKDSQFFQLVK